MQVKEGKFVNGIPLIVLIPCMITDWRKRKIPLLWNILCGIGMLFYQFVFAGQSIGSLLSSVLVGAILLAAAKICDQCIGYGDGIVFLVIGMWLGFWDTLVLLFGSLVLSSMKALFLILIKKKEKTYKIPFIPFVTAAYIILLIYNEI